MTVPASASASILMGIALFSGHAAPASQATDFCAGLQRIATASFETPAFKSVVRETPARLEGLVLPGGFERCSATRLSTSASTYGCSIAVPTSEEEAIALSEGLKGLVKKCYNDPLSYEPGLADQYGTRQTNFTVPTPAGTAEIAVYPRLTSNAEYRTVHLIVLGPEPKE